MWAVTASRTRRTGYLTAALVAPFSAPSFHFSTPRRAMHEALECARMSARRHSTHLALTVLNMCSAQPEALQGGAQHEEAKADGAHVACG